MEDRNLIEECEDGSRIYQIKVMPNEKLTKTRIKTDEKGRKEIAQLIMSGDLPLSENPFVWICFKYTDLLNVNEYNLERQEITRLIYFACFIGYDGYLKNNKTVITKSVMKRMSKLSKRPFYQFYNKMVELGILIEEDGKLKIKNELFSKGTLSNIIKKQNDFTRIYIKTVKYLYENTSVKHHNMLGIYFNLIPYIHRQSNIICYNPESEMEDIQTMTMGDLSKIVDYRKKIGQFIKDMTDITLDTGEKILFYGGTSSDKNEYKMVINPDVIYGGNYYLIPENREKIMGLFI